MSALRRAEKGAVVLSLPSHSRTVLAGLTVALNEKTAGGFGRVKTTSAYAPAASESTGALPSSVLDPSALTRLKATVVAGERAQPLFPMRTISFVLAGYAEPSTRG